MKGFKMKIIILKGRFSKKVFGFQIITSRYTFQYANYKIGLYDEKTYKWII